MNELTPRERKILGYYMQGMPQQKIADMVHLSKNNVQYLLTLMQQKLQLTNRAQLRAWARMQGFHDAQEVSA